MEFCEKCGFVKEQCECEDDKINLSDFVYGDFIRIFDDDEIQLNENMEVEVIRKGFIATKCIGQDVEDQITFNDCVTIAKEHGFTIGTFYIMAETPLSGTIYQYANCYDCEPYVSEYGTTRGYA